jgi:CDP-2,3-bis-(O-geranylgeranyl)-sn-glycerol synthase
MRLRMAIATTDSLACACFLMAALALAGVLQVVWLASSASSQFSVAMDGGLTFRRRRLFGENKTLRGFLVMVPAAAVTFPLVAFAVGGLYPATIGPWSLTPAGYARLGAWAALGFMLGELPNSFVKRQLDIAPGALASSRVGAICQFIADRLDSGIGMLAAVSVAVPTPWITWLVVLVFGPVVHWLFSVAMFVAGAKPRAA